MFTRANEVLRAHLAATDGLLGMVEDVIFEDPSWIIRYLAVETGTWLPGRKVLISPVTVKSVDIPSGIITTNLTRDQIRNAPSINQHPTLTRMHELALAEYYDWPRYWEETIYRDWLPSMRVLRGQHGPHVDVNRGKGVLCGFNELYGYRMEAIDGIVGHVEDLVFRDEDWLIRYIIADTRDLWPSRQVLVAPQWVTKIDWERKHLQVNLTREEIRHAPAFSRESLQDLTLEAMAAGRLK
jgi:hypothetical protein